MKNMQFVGLLVLSAFGMGCATVERTETVSGTDSKPIFTTVAMQETPEESPTHDAVEPAGRREPGHVILMYLPNRIMDVLDIVRLNARVGPGFGVGARATTVLDVFLGSYLGIYVGLPGPRQKPVPPMPVGFVSHSGVEISTGEAKIEGGEGPDYSPTEFGADVHLLLVGLDVAVDPVEVIDFVTGLFALEVRKDDM